MPSSLESLAESSLNEKKKSQKTKTRGKCLCCGSSAQGKAISSTRSHGHFPQSSPAPFRRAPSPQGVRDTPTNPIPSQPHASLSREARGLPEPGPSWPPMWLLPRQPSPPRCAHFLVFLSAVVGAEKLAHSGASFRHTLTPTVGQILNLLVQVQSSCSVKWGQKSRVKHLEKCLAHWKCYRLICY